MRLQVGAEERRFYGQMLRYAVILSAFFTGYGLIQPVLSLYVADFVGTSYLMVGTLISTIGLVKACMDPVSGFISDTYGRRRVAVAGALTISCGMLVSTFAASSEHLFLAFNLYGFGQAFLFLAIMASMVEVAGPSRRALALGIYEGGNGASILVGSAISGLLVKRVGLRLIFGLSTAFALCSFLLCISFMDETLSRRESGRSILDFKGVRELIGPEYALGMFYAFMYMYTHSLFMTVLPLYAKASMDVPVEMMSILFIGYSASTSIGSFSGGAISDRVGRRPPIASGMLLLVLGFSALPFLRSLLSLSLVSVVLGFASGFFHPVASSIIADVSASETRGKAYGFYRLVRDSGAFVGPAISGVVASLYGVDLVFIMTACLSAFGAFSTMFIANKISTM